MGKKQELYRITLRNQYFWIPHLKDFDVTSEATDQYNCFAWALGYDSKWVEPTTEYGLWPECIPDDLMIDSVIELFRLVGYEPCDSGRLESGYEKIAVYAMHGEATHAARQLPSGRWTSKIGQLEDIVHLSTEELQADDYYCYGRVALFMARPAIDC